MDVFLHTWSVRPLPLLAPPGGTVMHSHGLAVRLIWKGAPGAQFAPPCCCVQDVVFDVAAGSPGGLVPLVPLQQTIRMLSRSLSEILKSVVRP